MAYVPTTFVDRSVEFPNRRKLTPVSGRADTFDVVRAEGSVFVEGTKPDAANLNAEFGKIKTETDAINQSLAKFVITCSSSLLGKTIVCTNGIVSYSALVGTDLVVVFSVTLGSWNISCDNIARTINVDKTDYYKINYINFPCVTYGVDIDFSKTNPSSMCTYTDDAVGMVAGPSAWLSTPVFALLKNCVLKDGAVLGYLKKGNLAQYEDGSAANITTLGNDVMLEIGARIGYMIEWDSSNASLLHVKVTDNQNDSAFNYDAFSLDSYNDCDKIYIGAYKGYCTDSKAYSSTGRAVTVSQTIDTFRTWCRARGTGYEQRTYASVKLMQCLYLIQNKTLDSQSAIGMGYVASGHSAGVATGGTNAYGFNSEVIKASNPVMTDQWHQVKCLGIEDFWGNYWEFIDGLCTDASRNVLTCKCAANFDTDGTSYDNNGNGGVSANIGNYMSRCQGGSNAGFTAQTVAGSDSTYFCDSAALSASCLAIFGGCWNDASYAGAFRLDVTNAFSASAF